MDRDSDKCLLWGEKIFHIKLCLACPMESDRTSLLCSQGNKRQKFGKHLLAEQEDYEDAFTSHTNVNVADGK